MDIYCHLRSVADRAVNDVTLGMDASLLRADLFGQDEAFDERMIDRQSLDAIGVETIDAAVADMGPVGRIALHDAGGAGGPRPVLER